MKKKQKQSKMSILVSLAVIGMLAGCQTTSSETAQSAESSTTSDASTTTSTIDYDLEFSSDDLEVGYEEADLTTIKLADDQSTTSGEGASIDGNTLTITAGGTYLISGTLSDGQIKVTVPDTEEVYLILDGVDVTSSTSAPLLIEEAEKVFVTLAEDSENTLTDKAGSTAMIGTGDDATTIDGTIFSKADLTLNGSGNLTINGNTNHGIVSKDDLTIVSGTYQITAVGQGLSGKDAVKIKDGTFSMTTGTDGIQSDNDEEEGKGFVYIAGGDFTIDAEQDGIQAETLLQVDGGTFDITAGGGSANAVAKTSEGMGKDFFNQKAETETEENLNTEDTSSTSMKGLKATGELIINNGTITIDAADDTVHTDGNLTLTGGTLSLASGDDGLHAGNDLQLSGSTIAITESYEGIEGKTITISDGEITVVASDDGLNAASGTSTTSEAVPGETTSSSENLMVISGGTLTVNSSGDGLDSNGTLEISGGTIIVSGPENSGNGAIDSNGDTIITGGTLMAAGSSGMAVTFGDSSSQVSVLYGFETTYEAGSEIELSDADGTVLLSWTADKSFSSVQLSSADLEEDGTYTLAIDDETFEVTVDSIATTIGTTTGQMGGGKQHGNGDMQRPSEEDIGSMPELN
ncbi:carbohydrate-binding domain-containing protein [Carnobacterium sp. ISL-102]|uniref:carbohydrate-binding domain-containing protein n=1 Tax=Carnobacterium sp. ISL-102 TaxID=2819142 RepID=UPI001BEC0BAB|nr:carbohydrate-binding domain-containing protein [Carnobacterium sp. ISL-102]MBT2732535.1 carbohydrate-binding domain-containing protein [Carnobacterium sp. ISL-102]